MIRNSTLRACLVLSSVFATLGLSNCASEEAATDVVTCAPTTEACDGKDNDCDGKVDEDDKGNALVGTCTSNNKEGKKTCSNGKWSDCVIACTPKAEECNNEDDDCNGSIDGCYSYDHQ